MGLTLEKIRYRNLLDIAELRFSRRRITGIYGENANYILDIINGDITDYDGLVMNDKSVINSDYYLKSSSSIALIDEQPFYTAKVCDEFKLIADVRKYECANIEKRAKELLGELGLNSELYEREIHTLSSSEKYLIRVAVNLLYDPEIIMFKDIFSNLDHKYRKLLTVLLNNLKEEKKVIIVTSNDINLLYQLTDDVVLLNKNHIYRSGNSDKIFTSMDIMKENVIPMPSIIKVSYLAKTDKKIKLSFHKDVRDIIKDIYKHV